MATKAQDRAAEILRALLTKKSEAYSSALEELEGDGKRPLILHNLDASALAYVAATLHAKLKRPMLILTAGMERAELLTDDLEFFGIEEPLHYPKWEILPYDDEDLSLEVTSKHLDVFLALEDARVAKPGAKDRRLPVIAAPVDATMLKCLPTNILEDRAIRFSWGDRLDLAKLANDLDAAGYTREPVVESRGEFSIRGSIVDIYPPNVGEPIRLDLFGDEIESIRTFDVATQRSTGDLGADAQIAIPPSHLKHLMDRHIKEGGKLESFYELLPPDTLILMDGPERYQEVCTYFENAVERQFHEIYHGQHALGPPENLRLTHEDVMKAVGAFRRVEHSRLPIDVDDKKTRHVSFKTAGFNATPGDLPSWMAAIRRYQHEDYLIVVTCDNEGQVQRFDDVLREAEISARQLVTDDQATAYRVREAVEGYRDVVLTLGGPSEGILFQDARVAVITDREIFGRYKRRHVYRKLYKGRAVASSNELQRGDFVVHVDNGIGIYRGVRQQNLDGRTMDLLELEYANNDKLLVPVEKIRTVQKYAGSDMDNVVLDKLGGTRWIKKKRKNQEEIEKMAEELLRLYARREVARREPFKPDTHHQTEFEASFPYTETPDQLKAILEVKRDLESYRPMDRLLCGDVGYGKTEVAIRSVFKCVEEGKQAAILVPTTVLALQHFRTFKERYAEFPKIRVECMSRFQSAKEIREIKQGIKAGEVHVVVGTHKLLGKDIEFVDLGLLVIDEEQRFGVKAKERLKELRAEVDILTMSATPIPRTLHMAMSGLRDLSIITTPPADRLPIRTKIIHWNEEQMAEAILRELNRGGQVFFIHNRVHNIADVANRLQKIVPHAKIGIAHGQMKESELEDHMLKFIGGEYDILVSTTIVESGIDIPNANTMIVNRADAFGLAQLYQLRGRVGRQKRRAYAYLIVPQGQAVTETAVKRLAAIEEFTELGSGFSIAMRDMEIRGTGSLLGKEQHGVLNEIGFELYCDMLHDAVARLRGDEVVDQYDVEVKWPISSYIPAGYILVETQRVNFYKRLAMMRADADVIDLTEELKDRYGELPDPVRALLELTRLRLAGARVKLLSVDGSHRERTRLNLLLPEAEQWTDAIKAAAKETQGISAAVIEGEQTIYVTTGLVKEEDGGEIERIRRVREFLHAARKRLQPAEEALANSV
ncbi:MAG: transcription-repair coupling factor [Sumerlaeia bacterium]